MLARFSKHGWSFSCPHKQLLLKSLAQPTSTMQNCCRRLDEFQYYVLAILKRNYELALEAQVYTGWRLISPGDPVHRIDFISTGLLSPKGARGILSGRRKVILS